MAAPVGNYRPHGARDLAIIVCPDTAVKDQRRETPILDPEPTAVRGQTTGSYKTTPLHLGKAIPAHGRQSAAPMGVAQKIAILKRTLPYYLVRKTARTVNFAQKDRQETPNDKKAMSAVKALLPPNCGTAATRKHELVLLNCTSAPDQGTAKKNCLAERGRREIIHWPKTETGSSLKTARQHI